MVNEVNIISNKVVEKLLEQSMYREHSEETRITRKAP